MRKASPGTTALASNALATLVPGGRTTSFRLPTTGAAPQTWTSDLQFAEYRPQFDLMMAFGRQQFAADRALSVSGHTGLNLLIYDHLLHLFQDLLVFRQRKAGGFRP
jgi:hypothetical protein